MEGICCICQELREVVQLKTVKPYQQLLANSKDAELLVCEDCTPIAVKAVSQALKSGHKANVQIS